MKIKSSRLYSHPVLSTMYDDYKNSVFKVTVKAYKKVRSMTIDINVELTNDKLNELIEKEIAKIVCHLECPKTKLRYTKDLNIGDNKIEINNANLNDQLQIITFVVANKDIDNYYSSDFNDDFQDNKFYIEYGSVLAISNQIEIPIEKDIYDLSKVPSIVSIVPYASETDHKIYIDMDSDKIMVRLQKNDYTNYSGVGKGKSKFTPILHSMLIIPALTYVFDVLKSDSETFYSYENKRWFKALDKRFNGMNKTFNYDDLKQQDSFTMAQEILEVPICEALEKLNMMGE